MNTQQYNAVLTTLDHLAKKWAGRPDRKGALQDVLTEKTRLQLEYETANPMPTMDQVIHACALCLAMGGFFVVLGGAL